MTLLANRENRRLFLALSSVLTGFALLLRQASKQYEQTIIMITHNRSIAQTASRVRERTAGDLHAARPAITMRSDPRTPVKQANRSGCASVRLDRKSSGASTDVWLPELLFFCRAQRISCP